MGSKLYVGNLSYSTNEETLRAVFEGDGRQVQEVSLILDRETGRSRGFAFVQMASAEQAQAAIKDLDGLVVDGRNLRVKEALEREQRGPGGPPRSGPPRSGPPRGPGGPRPAGPPGRGPGGAGPRGPDDRPGRFESRGGGFGDRPPPAFVDMGGDPDRGRGGRSRNGRGRRGDGDLDRDRDSDGGGGGRGRGRKGNWKRDWDI